MKLKYKNIIAISVIIIGFIIMTANCFEHYVMMVVGICLMISGAGAMGIMADAEDLPDKELGDEK